MKEISYQSIQLDEFGDIIPLALPIEIDKAKKGDAESAKLLLKEFSNFSNISKSFFYKIIIFIVNLFQIVKGDYKFWNFVNGG